MTHDAPTMKDWQHGYALDYLLAIEALYAQYNSYSVSPFSAVKKHTIAALLHDHRLKLVDGGAYSVTVSKATSPITVYNDVVLARKQPGDITIGHLAGDRQQIAMALQAYLHTPAWATAWADDRETQRMLERCAFTRIGSKVSTFGEIVFVYFRHSRAATADTLFDNARHFDLLPAAEFVGIKRLGHVGSVSLLDTIHTLQRLDLAFTNHYSNYNKANAWSALSLRGFSADPAFIAKPIEMSKRWKAEHAHEVYAIQDTSLKAQFPDIDRLVAPYGDVFERMRFMQLAPGGGELDRHTDQVDPETGVRMGNNARLHIPIITNEQVEFTSWDLYNQPHTVNMRVGEVWYLDTRKPHRAINAGMTNRIHLVVDVIVTQRFIDLLSA